MSWLEGLAEPDWRECYSDSEVQETARQALDLIDDLLKEQKEKMEHLNNITLEYEKEVFRLQTLLKEDCHNCKLECLLQKYDELKEKYDALLKEQEKEC